MVLPMPVVYRAMTGADHAGVSVLLAERLPGVQIEALRLYRGYVAVEDKHIVAVALLHDHPPLTARGGGRQALLHAFASGQGGRGIGSNLLRYVHDRLALAGYCSILVKIVGVEGPVHDWYRRTGYDVDLVIGFDYGGDRPWWVIAAAGESHAAIVLDDSLRICQATLDVRELAKASRQQS
jgi:hypothetical protein